jgi:hypothetical protein
MSYTPGFAPDAESQWHALDPHHQELALDVLDRLCASPPRHIEHVGEVVYEEAGVKHHLFVHVVVDHEKGTVTSVGVGHAALPVPP